MSALDRAARYGAVRAADGRAVKQPGVALLVGIVLDLPMWMLPALLFTSAITYTAWSAWWV